MKKLVIVVASALLGVVVLGFFVAYDIRGVRQLYRRFTGRAMPADLERPRIVLGANQFAQGTFYSGPGLDLITDIQDSPDQEIVVVGRRGVAFVREDRSAAQVIHFDSGGCRSDVTSVNLEKRAFLCRGGWSLNTRLFDQQGKILWSYGDTADAIDDATAGELGSDGAKRVVVGFNGGGGVRLLTSDAKELWKQVDGNVWHVEIIDAGSKSGNVIVHSNAAGRITLRDSTGTVLASYQPEIYLAHFSLTAWGDDPHRNKLVAADGDSVYILNWDATTLVRLHAPYNEGIVDPQGTPVRFAGGAVYYATLLRHSFLGRSLLYIYDPQNHLVYQEVIGQNCGALHAAPGINHTEDLLVGCDSAVRKYWMNGP